MRFFYLILSFLMVFCCLDPAFAKRRIVHIQVKHPRPIAASIFGTAQLANSLNSIINTDSTAAIAVYVKSMRDGETLFTRNVNQPFTPASTLKVLTAEAGLIFLGPEYQFSTQLLTDAKTIRNGVLQGNLYIIQSGDPSLTYNDVVDLMLNLKAHQVTSIAGNVFIDGSAYDNNFYGPGWEWQDKNYCYAAPISSGIVNHNCLPLKVTPSAAGKLAQIETFPKFFYPSIKNSVVTKAGRGHACSLHLSSSLATGLAIDGCMPTGRYAWGLSYVVADVPEYNRAMYRGVLRQLGVSVNGAVTYANAKGNLSELGTHKSKPLKSLVYEMLKKSDNIIAGALFKKIGQVYMRKPGSWQNGGIAVSQILAKRAGMNSAGSRILDGSGLSPANLTTPMQMMQVLDFAYHNEATSFDFISALPIAGVDGTLKHRMGNIARKVRAKTGTISGVRTLAGYALSANKEPLAFVIMINGSKGMGWSYKEMEDKIVTALTRYQGA